MKNQNNFNYDKPILHYAITHQWTAAAAMGLLERGADPDMEDSIGMTPLAVAIKKNSPTVVSALLKKGADPDRLLPFDDRALHLAVKKTNSGSLISALLKAGACVDARNESCQTPLMFAITNLNISMSTVKIMIDSGADINATDAEDASVLEYAISAGNIAAVKFLIGCGANVHHKNMITGDSALHYAAAKGLITIARMLCGAGIDVNVKSLSDSRTPLHHAAQYCSNHHMIQELISLGALIDLVDHDGNTPLHCCAMGKNDSHIMSVLLTYNPKVLLNKKNQTPLELAVEKACSHKISLLTDYPTVDNTRMREYFSAANLLLLRYKDKVTLAAQNSLFDFSNDDYQFFLETLTILADAIEQTHPGLQSSEYYKYQRQSSRLKDLIQIACPDIYSSYTSTARSKTNGIPFIWKYQRQWAVHTSISQRRK